MRIDSNTHLLNIVNADVPVLNFLNGHVRQVSAVDFGGGAVGVVQHHPQRSVVSVRGLVTTDNLCEK